LLLIGTERNDHLVSRLLLIIH